MKNLYAIVDKETLKNCAISLKSLTEVTGHITEWNYGTQVGVSGR